MTLASNLTAREYCMRTDPTDAELTALGMEGWILTHMVPFTEPRHYYEADARFGPKACVAVFLKRPPPQPPLTVARDAAPVTATPEQVRRQVTITVSPPLEGGEAPTDLNLPAHVRRVMHGLGVLGHWMDRRCIQMRDTFETMMMGHSWPKQDNPMADPLGLPAGIGAHDDENGGWRASRWEMRRQYKQAVWRATRLTKAGATIEEIEGYRWKVTRATGPVDYVDTFEAAKYAVDGRIGL